MAQSGGAEETAGGWRCRRSQLASECRRRRLTTAAAVWAALAGSIKYHFSTTTRQYRRCSSSTVPRRKFTYWWYSHTPTHTGLSWHNFAQVFCFIFYSLDHFFEFMTVGSANIIRSKSNAYWGCRSSKTDYSWASETGRWFKIWGGILMHEQIWRSNVHERFYYFICLYRLICER